MRILRCVVCLVVVCLISLSALAFNPRVQDIPPESPCGDIDPNQPCYGGGGTGGNYDTCTAKHAYGQMCQICGTNAQGFQFCAQVTISASCGCDQDCVESGQCTYE